MTGFTDRTSQGILNHITGKSALFAMPTSYIGLFTGAGTDAGTGFTEVAGGAYVRRSAVAADWNAASGSGPSQISNVASLTYPTATADWGIVIAFGLYDALTSGNLLAWDFFGNFQWKPATVAGGSPAVFTTDAHGYVAGDAVRWTNEHGGSLAIAGTLIVAAPVTATTFTLTSAGSPVAAGATGSGMVRKILPQAIINGASAVFPPGSFIITSS